MGWEAERGAQQIDRGSARLVIFQFSRNRRPLRILWGNNIGSCTTVDVSERALPLRHTTLTVDVKRGTNRLCTTPEPTPRVALVLSSSCAPSQKGQSHLMVMHALFSHARAAVGFLHCASHSSILALAPSSCMPHHPPCSAVVPPLPFPLSPPPLSPAASPFPGVALTQPSTCLPSSRVCCARAQPPRRRTTRS